MPIDPELLEILRCPDSHAPLVVDGEWLVSTAPATRRRYQVQDDIPNMIIEDAEVMEEEAWIAVMKTHGVVPGGGPEGSGGT
ncbi:MAG: hypothetical protein CMJ83_02450 [Planctomycetes bacterium]|nr:hypothetical protein [Planctomycetota bacterium]